MLGGWEAGLGAVIPRWDWEDMGTCTKLCAHLLSLLSLSLCSRAVRVAVALLLTVMSFRSLVAAAVLFMWTTLPAFGAASYVPAIVLERPLFTRWVS